MKVIEMERTIQMHLEEDEKLMKLILITFSTTWNIVIALQTYIVAFLVISTLAFDTMSSSAFALIIVCDLFFLVDFVAGVFYISNWRIRQFRSYQTRKWILYVFDVLSLLPLALVYESYVAEENKNKLLSRIFLQNRCLRIYRIYMLMNTYDLTFRNAPAYALLLFFRFVASSALLSHVLTCVWTNLPHSVACEGSDWYCALWHETYIFITIIHHYVGPANMFKTYQERFLVIIAMICGIILIYGDFIPYILLIFMRVTRTQGEYFQKYLQLERYLLNINVSPELTEQIQKYFRYFWNSGTTSIEMDELLQDLPLALRKEIFTDIYWDAFRHSDIFKSVSRCCKRSISLCMSTQYCQEGEVIFAKNKLKTMMIYLVHGIMELMAEENENSPIMSFSSGTVLGEMSLFMMVASHGTVKCRTICEIQTLELQDAFRVLRDYPKDKNLIFQKLNKRLVIAKITQWRKRQINLEKMIGMDVSGGSGEEEDSVKWVKKQWRGIWEAHERHQMVVKAIEDGLRIPAWRKQYDIQVRLDSVSNYMDLMVLSDVFEEKKDVVCLKTTFPWSIDPKAHFLKVWRLIVLLFAIFASVAYPFCAAWLHVFPMAVFTTSCITTLIFEADLILSMMTAVKTKHGILTKFWSILMHLLKKPTFYLDVVAALPVQLYLAFTNFWGYDSDYSGAFLLTGCCKAHIFLKPKTNMSEGMVTISLVKNSLLYLLLVFWFAAFFQLFLVRCIPKCIMFQWQPDTPVYGVEFVRKNLISLFVAFSAALSLPDPIIRSDDIIYHMGYAIIHTTFFFWTCFVIGDFYTVYSFTVSNQLRFKVLYTRVVKYLESIAIPALVERRILRLVRFQWVYNRADDLLTKVPIIYLAPLALRREVYADTIFQTLKKCPLFEMESDEFVFDVIEKCNLIAVPAGTILVDYGLKCNRIYLLHKGYCQVNSFLKNDVSGGLGSPVLMQPGNLFPTLATFATVPVPVSVITLTDCEVVVVELEDLLKTMIMHNVFNDVVNVISTNNFMDKLSNHTLAMIQVNVQYNTPLDEESAYSIPFKKLGCFGKVLKRLLLKRNLYYDENQRPKQFLKFINFFYMIFLLQNALLWPMAFGLLIFIFRIVIYFLVLSDTLFFLAYVYIQLHVPYFDKRGLLITHPLYTTARYLSTSFMFDLIINLPVYICYKFTSGSATEQDSQTIVLLVITQKTLGMFLVNLYIDDMIKESNYLFLLGPMKLFLIIIVVINSLANYHMFCAVEWIFDGPFKISQIKAKYDIGYLCHSVNEHDILMFYTYVTHWIFSHFSTNYVPCLEYDWTEVIYANAYSFVGVLATLGFYGWLACHSGVGDSSATIYQERMKAFLEFLLLSKTDDKIVENSIGYFEHQWSRTRGQNLLEICDNVPSHLLEELAYPLYRPTLNKIGPFQNADESFYRILSIHLELVHFNRGSIVFFKGQVQNDIYFIHRGKCFVFDWFITLEVGSLIGDIKRTGKLENKVYALTHVELLRIKSTIFYKIINSFYEIETEFKHLIKTAENFVKTPYVPQTIQLRPVDSRDILNAFNLQSKNMGFEDQSFFEDPENIATQNFFVGKHRAQRKHFGFIIYPGTWPMAVYKIMLSTVAFLTMVVMPWLIFYGSLTVIAFSIIGVLDSLWFIFIIMAFRIGLEDKVKGDIVTNSRTIMKSYIMRWDGFFLGLIACIPFELIALLLTPDWKQANLTLIGWLRGLRFIRGYYLIKYLNAEVSKLKVSSVINYLSVVVYFVLYVHCLVLFYLMIGSAPEVFDSMDPFRMTRAQLESLLMVYQNSLSLITSSNLHIFIFTTKAEILYFNTVALLSLYVRGLIIKNMLSIKYVYSVARGKYKSQVSRLESCLKRHELSPSIMKDVLDYKLNILIATRSENMPTFLLNSPDSLKLGIMTDLYMSRLINSPIFRGVDLNFLKLLACRMKRVIYFPGQKIVEKGDVDNTMYFIHNGEVYIIDQTEGDAYIEFVVDHMYPGDEFGQVQGVASAFPHTNTYRARTVVEMITLYTRDWLDLKQAYTDEFSKIIQSTKNLARS